MNISNQCVLQFKEVIYYVARNNTGREFNVAIWRTSLGFSNFYTTKIIAWCNELEWLSNLTSVLKYTLQKKVNVVRVYSLPYANRTFFISIYGGAASVLARGLSKNLCMYKLAYTVPQAAPCSILCTHVAKALHTLHTCGPTIAHISTIHKDGGS